MAKTRPAGPGQLSFLDGYLCSQVAGGGSLAWDDKLRALIAGAIKRSSLSRAQLADRMMELAGETITIHQIDSWTAPSKAGHRFPLALLPAMSAALNDMEILRELVAMVGGRLATREDLAYAEIGRLHVQGDRVREREKALRVLMESDK